ncbi:sigma-54-dependent transcriptional regulator [Desulfosediminicola sp.]|uniref:sigma-54-dependent transcriptional regulator n=1 Tax=Desulfosediminicola sp. TaxID=2886825 RepID=UPI003AF217ED
MMNLKNPCDPILVVDDEESILLSVDTILQMAGMNNVITCSDSRQVLSIVERNSPSVVLLDLNMPHVNGEAIIEKLSAHYPRIPIVVITGRIDAETAVDCLKSGAADYIVKPVDEERLLATIRKTLRSGELRDSKSDSTSSTGDKIIRPECFSHIITQSPKLIEIFEYLESIASTSEPVLVRGETGTGKELIARAIHNLSGRKGEFVAVNVAGLDDNVFSDTLFGHVKGAFTGADIQRSGLIERAAEGTLFLDEIGDLSPASQVKLLRLLQEHEYMPLGQDSLRRSSARIITSTHVDIWDLQRRNIFRKDLHYRLRTHRVLMPPLRDRKEDLPLLLDHFIDKASDSLLKNRPNRPPELLTLLETYTFPGNVRELQAMVFDAIAQHKNGTLSMIVFREHMARMKQLEADEQTIHFADITGTTNEYAGSPASFKSLETLPSIKQATKMLIEEAMERADNNQSIAASLLGISQQALSKRLKNLSQEK